MDKITLEELLSKDLLAVPEADAVLSLKQLRQGARFENRGGVYTIFNAYREALYVGISNNVDKRIREHLGSEKGNPDILKYIKQGNQIYVSVFYEPDKLHQEIYEAYLIYQLNPRFNVHKTGRQKIW